jgi:hypothetical protein
VLFAQKMGKLNACYFVLITSKITQQTLIKFGTLGERVQPTSCQTNLILVPTGPTLLQTSSFFSRTVYHTNA